MRYPNYIPVPYRQPVNIVVVLVLLVVVYFLLKKFGVVDKKQPEGAEVKTNPSKNPPRAGFNPANEVNKLADLLSNTWDGGGEDSKAFSAILNYGDNEVILVHNQWRKTYAGGQFWQGIKPTLRQQVNAETIAWYRTDVVEKKNLVLKKLDRLNL